MLHCLLLEEKLNFSCKCLNVCGIQKQLNYTIEQKIESNTEGA